VRDGGAAASAPRAAPRGRPRIELLAWGKEGEAAGDVKGGGGVR